MFLDSNNLFSLMITELHQQIENGEYFERARNWYADKYLAVDTQTFALSLCLIVILIGGYFSIDSMMDKYFAIKYPIPVYVDDQINFRLNIKPLTRGSESIDTSVSRALLTRYVINREEYRYNGVNLDIIQEKFASIRSNSSRRIYTNYLNYMDPQKNPDSPILKYKLQTERMIEILSVNFPKGIDRPEFAKIMFRSVEKHGEKELISYWSTDINFSLNNITDILDNKNELNFIVTSYTVTEELNYKG